MMRFGQLDYEIRQCEQHLDATGTRNTLIENYLVRYLLVRICAEFETRIEILVQKRCAARTNDTYLLKFAYWGTEIATKRYRISDISKMLGKFGDDYRNAFIAAVMSDTCHIAWDNICTNRHTIAHEDGAVNMSFTDLKRDYAASLLVIDEIVKALCLRPKDIKGLK